MTQHFAEFLLATVALAVFSVAAMVWFLGSGR